MTKPDSTPAPSEPGIAPDAPAVSAGDLAFVLDVLVPRVWVSGAEVDALIELRQKLAAILEEVGHDAHA